MSKDNNLVRFISLDDYSEVKRLIESNFMSETTFLLTSCDLFLAHSFRVDVSKDDAELGKKRWLEIVCCIMELKLKSTINIDIVYLKSSFLKCKTNDSYESNLSRESFTLSLCFKNLYYEQSIREVESVLDDYNDGNYENLIDWEKFSLPKLNETESSRTVTESNLLSDRSVQFLLNKYLVKIAELENKLKSNAFDYKDIKSLSYKLKTITKINKNLLENEIFLNEQLKFVNYSNNRMKDELIALRLSDIHNKISKVGSKNSLLGKGRKLLKNKTLSVLGKSKKYTSNYDILAESEFFDPSWYLKKYTDVLLDGGDPILHYLNYGYKEERDPSPYFSTSRYLIENPDVKENGVNPLVHYIKYGMNEGRKF